MTRRRIVRGLQSITCGFLLLQAGGCDLTGLNEFVQTVFLGITAAGSVAIIRNI